MYNVRTVRLFFVQVLLDIFSLPCLPENVLSVAFRVAAALMSVGCRAFPESKPLLSMVVSKAIDERTEHVHLVLEFCRELARSCSEFYSVS